MKSSVTARIVNKIAIVILLSGSLVYHVREGLQAKEKSSDKRISFQRSHSLYPDDRIPSSRIPFIVVQKDRFFHQ